MHIISLPLTLPRFNFHLKHTLVRTALKNGAAFEICYVGSLGGQKDPVFTDASYAEVRRRAGGRRRVVSGGAINQADLRAPKGVANLYAIVSLLEQRICIDRLFGQDSVIRCSKIQHITRS